MANAYAQINFYDASGDLLNSAQYQLNATDATKFFAAFIATYPPPQGQGAYTTAQIIGIIAQAAFQGWTAFVNNYTASQAAAVAVANVSNPINPTLSYTTAP